jgi:hypothetical protein
LYIALLIKMVPRAPPKLQEKMELASPSVIPAAATATAVDCSTSASTAAIFDNDDIYEEVFRDEYKEKQPVDAAAIQVADGSATTTTATSKQLFPSKKALLLIVAILSIGSVVLVASILVYSMNRGSDDATDMGTSYRENLGIRQEIAARLGGGAQAKQLLESPLSPYAKALEWMIHQDPVQLVPGDANFFQRYILAYLYYATTIKGPWRSCNPALSGEWETCTHAKGVHYDAVLSNRWLSSVHECMFAGIVCNHKMQVTAIQLSKSMLWVSVQAVQH